MLIQLWALPVRAELVFFTSGRTLSVKAHRTEGDLLVLTLRGGGEMTCDPSVVARIGPDEVPYPELEEMVRLQSDTTGASGAAGANLAGPAETNFSGGVRLQADVVPYAAIIDKVAAEQGVDVRLVRAVIQVESAYERTARSPKGAMGLMQLMPETARHYAVADPYDPVANIEAGIKHLKALLQRFPVSLALAAYNAGEASVQRFRGIPPYPETRSYVTRILELAGR